MSIMLRLSIEDGLKRMSSSSLYLYNLRSERLERYSEELGLQELIEHRDENICAMLNYLENQTVNSSKYKELRSSLMLNNCVPLKKYSIKSILRYNVMYIRILLELEEVLPNKLLYNREINLDTKESLRLLSGDWTINLLRSLNDMYNIRMTEYIYLHP